MFNMAQVDQSSEVLHYECDSRRHCITPTVGDNILLFFFLVLILFKCWYIYVSIKITFQEDFYHYRKVIVVLGS